LPKRHCAAFLPLAHVIADGWRGSKLIQMKSTTLFLSATNKLLDIISGFGYARPPACAGLSGLKLFLAFCNKVLDWRDLMAILALSKRKGKTMAQAIYRTNRRNILANCGVARRCRLRSVLKRYQVELATLRMAHRWNREDA
jgi:hypothetical protein